MADRTRQARAAVSSNSRVWASTPRLAIGQPQVLVGSVDVALAIAILAEGQVLLPVAWWISTLPGVALLLVLAIDLLGDTLRDAMAPEG